MNIGILGVGRLGLCFALNLERAGHIVSGIDIDEGYVQQLNHKTFTSFEPQVNELLRNSKNFKASSQLQDVINDETEVLFVMVATPSLPNGSYNHSQIERIAKQLTDLGKRKKPVHLVIGCTVMPGYCDELQKQLEAYNYTVSYNPEFIAQGNIISDQLYPDQLLIGEANAEAGDVIQRVYDSMCLNKPVVCRMSRLSAEICKLATNCFLTTKISFANIIGDIATNVGAEPEKILAAIGADTRIGDKYLKYGFGFGGPCFPRDNRALNLFAKSIGHTMLIGEATDVINKNHLEFQFENYLKQYAQEEVIRFDEVTYKKGSYILEESQQLALAVKLAKAGRKVLIREKQKIVDELKKEFGHLFAYEIMDKTP